MASELKLAVCICMFTAKGMMFCTLILSILKSWLTQLLDYTVYQVAT